MFSLSEKSRKQESKKARKQRKEKKRQKIEYIKTKWTYQFGTHEEKKKMVQKKEKSLVDNDEARPR
jgi:hypothetical protein